MAETESRPRSSAVVLAGLVTLTVASPLLVGGAPPAAQLALAMATLFVGTAALAQRSHRLRARPLLVFFALSALLSALQLLPLPPALLSALSPEAFELRSEVGQVGWMPISLDTAATFFALLRDLMLLVAFAVATSVGRSTRRSRAVAAALAASAVVVGIAALLERASGTTKIFGIYEFTNWPGSGIWGGFVNGNHAASLFSIGALVAAGAGIELQGSRRFAAIVIAGFLAGMTLYTGSRGGALGLFAGGALLAVWMLGRRFGRWRGLGLAVVAMLAIAGPSLLLAEGLRHRLRPAELSELWANQKTRGWMSALSAASTYKLTGVGRGAFEAPVAAYRADDEGVRLVYAENFVVQRLVELGWPSTLLLLALAIAGVWHLRPGFAHLSPLFAGVACAIVGIVVHELFDFGTELPGVGVPFVVALGTVAGQAIEQGKLDASPIPRWLPVVVLLALLGTTVIGRILLPVLPDRDFKDVASMVRANPATTGALVDDARRRHPADGYFDLLAAERSLRARDRNPLPSLNRAMRRLPSEPKSHWMAARVLVAMKHRSQAAIEYRAAIARGLAPPWDELVRALSDDVIDAVPQLPALLDELTRQAFTRGRFDLGERLIERFINVSEGSEASLGRAVELAERANDPALLRKLIVRLLDSRPGSAESFLRAARAAGALGDKVLLERALSFGTAANPASVAMVLEGVRLWLRSGETLRARQLLRSFQTGAATLAERRDRELLLADIATREGALDEAVGARARAAAFERQIKEHSK